LLALPAVDEALLAQMIKDIVAKFSDLVPDTPGSMYIRPTHIGTDAAIGKAAAPSDESMMYVLLSPVGEYFSGESTLRLLIEEQGMRCAPDNGMVKSGGNYASALKHIVRAKADYNADQVLFSSVDGVTETGAANFILFDGDELITKPLDESFLHGVTRDSILTLAAEQGLTISERDLSIEELIKLASHPAAEAALSGTAAILTPVGTLIYQGKEYLLGSGKAGPVVAKMRAALNDIQWGKVPDTHHWLTKV
jgi:branched-chain amino acid aminotransferase